MGPQYSNVVYHNLHIKSAVGKKGRLLHEKGLNPKRKISGFLCHWPSNICQLHTWAKSSFFWQNQMLYQIGIYICIYTPWYPVICYPHLLFANLPSHTIPWSFADSISIYICTTYVFEPSFSDRPIYIYTIMLCCLYKLWISILCWTVIFGHTHTFIYTV